MLFVPVPQPRSSALLRLLRVRSFDHRHELIFGFVRGDGRASRIAPRGLAPAEVAQRFAGGWDVDAENRGGPMFGSAAYWYMLHRR
jgi:hypothetical protein